MLGMKQSDLAGAAGVSLATLNNIERGASDPKSSTLTAIRRALEDAGVNFFGDTGVEIRRAASVDAGIPTQQPGVRITVERKADDA